MKSEPFVKVFESDTYGQIAVIKDADENSFPVVKVSVNPKGARMDATFRFEDILFGEDE